MRLDIWESNMESLPLLSGDTMPVVGLGTYPLKGEQCKRVVKQALDLGYTHFDTAWIYRNQREIGEALREAGVDRSRLFITTKVGQDYLQYDVAVRQADENLQLLQMDYVDLLLVHWPPDDVPMEETIGAFNTVFDAGKARSIGVSNFSVEQMEEACRVSSAPISVNQIKYHPGYELRDVLQWCLERDVVVTAYSPLGKKNILQDPVLTNIARSHNRTSAHVALRWLLQKGMNVIPKASSELHLRANLDVFDWSLSEDEMAAIDGMAD